MISWTRKTLESYTRKELGELAKRRGVVGCSALRKDELIAELLKARRTLLRRRTVRSVSRTNGRKSRVGMVGQAASRSNGRRSGQKSKRKHSSRKTHEAARPSNTPVGLVAIGPPLKAAVKPVTERDRLAVEVCDSYWLYITWELKASTLERAAAALGADWHRAVPVLRVYDVTDDETGGSEKLMIREMAIHGDSDGWYVPVTAPPKTFTVEIGYCGPGDRFFRLAQSPKVRTRVPGSRGSAKRTWQELKAKRAAKNGRNGKNGRASGNGSVYVPALTGTSAPGHKDNRSSNGANGRNADFHLNCEAELVVYGSTSPHAKLSMLGESVPVNKDGTFALRFSLPDGRQVIPAVSVTPDGSEQRTVVLAVERNTKTLAPKLRDEP